MSEILVRELFPNIPSPEHTRMLSLKSDAMAYIKQYGSNDLAISNLEYKCKMCAIDDCGCRHLEVIEAIRALDI